MLQEACTSSSGHTLSVQLNISGKDVFGSKKPTIQKLHYHTIHTIPYRLSVFFLYKGPGKHYKDNPDSWHQGHKKPYESQCNGRQHTEVKL